MKCMTFNIWNYTRPWKQRQEMIADIIGHHRPDVVALQETRHDWRYERGKGQGEQLAESVGYRATVAVGQVYVPLLHVDESLTILTLEEPLRTVRKNLTMLPHEREDENQRVCVGVVVGSAAGPVWVFNTHFSLSARARVSNAMEVTAFIHETAGEAPSLLLGDLNSEPDEHAIRYLRGELSIDGLTGDFSDCWLAGRPGDPGYTYASSQPVRRIDYVLARNLRKPVMFAERLGDESRGGTFASDHLGVIVEIAL